jgi:hypothetical protein
MNKKSTKTQDIEEIAEQAQAGADVSDQFTGNFRVKQHLTIALPLDFIHQIDAECQRQQISRQEWIKRACAAQLNSLPPAAPAIESAHVS